MSTPMPTRRTAPDLTPAELIEMADRLEEARQFHLARLDDGDGSDGDDIRMAMARRSESALEEVEAALNRIDSGTFGVCLSCLGQISVERMEAIPHTAVCVNCVGKD